MKITLLLTLLLGTLSVFANGQATNKLTDSLLVSPTKFKLLATNVSYQGEKCSPSDKTDKVYSDSSEPSALQRTTAKSVILAAVSVVPAIKILPSV